MEKRNINLTFDKKKEEQYEEERRNEMISRRITLVVVILTTIIATLSLAFAIANSKTLTRTEVSIVALIGEFAVAIAIEKAIFLWKNS